MKYKNTIFFNLSNTPTRSMEKNMKKTRPFRAASWFDHKRVKIYSATSAAFALKFTKSSSMKFFT